VNHDENPPTSIQSFFLYFVGCWANLPATMHRVLMILLPSILFSRQAFQDSITSQRRRFRRWRRPGKQQRIHRLW
jgi:hypothetical protein